MRSCVVALLALLPAATYAGTPLDRARAAGAAQAEATARHQRAADEAVKPDAPAAPPAQDAAVPAPAPAVAAPGADAQPDVDVGPAPDVDASWSPTDPPANRTEAYQVQRGDTLWDLSGKFLKSPWYWPKIWSYNPEITNPHWIYPGRTLRIHAEGPDAPGRVDPGDDDGAEARPTRELEGFSRADSTKPQDYGEGDEVAVVGPYKIGHVPPKGVFARRDSFVTVKELEEAGALSASSDDKTYLSICDRGYARFKSAAPVRIGETYVLFRTDRLIKHPVTAQVFGWQTTIIGTAKVVAVDDRMATVEIVGAFDPIERGTYLGPWKDRIVKHVQRRPNGRDLDGYIIAAQQDVVTEIGEHHLVFVDKGRQDGVEEGNVFTVTRSGDPTLRAGTAAAAATLPVEDIGALMVVDAQATASTALVVRSVRELAIGDRVAMKAGPGVAAVAPAS